MADDATMTQDGRTEDEMGRTQLRQVTLPLTSLRAELEGLDAPRYDPPTNELEARLHLARVMSDLEEVAW